MPLIRYECTLSPDALKYPTAFAPVPASTIAKYSNRAAQGQAQTGEPGTRAIPAPSPGFNVPGLRQGPGSPLPGGSGGGGATGSQYMPAAWFPSLYYATQQLWGAIGGVQVYSDNRIPHQTSQAVGTTQVPGMRPRKAQALRGRQVAAPPNTPRWALWRPRDVWQSARRG